MTSDYSLYPAGPRLVATFEKELLPYQVRKGTIRFPLGQAVPVRLISRIAKFLAKEAALRARAEPAKGRR